jgi:hypothetical protein
VVNTQRRASYFEPFENFGQIEEKPASFFFESAVQTEIFYNFYKVMLKINFNIFFNIFLNKKYFKNNHKNIQIYFCFHFNPLLTLEINSESYIR